MGKRGLLLIFAIICSIFLIGCAKDEELPIDTEKEQTAKDAVENEKEDTIDEVNAETGNYEKFIVEMDDTVGWIKTGPGEYKGENYDEEAVKEEIATWPKELRADEYFYRILALTAEDFTKYQEYLDEVEVAFADITVRPGTEAARGETEEEQGLLNVQILLDASGSMGAQVDGEVKMDLAKEAITDFAANLPESAQVSLRVYGHEGTNQLDGKEESCSITEEVYALGVYDESGFGKALNEFGPTGYTPLALAIEAALDDLSNVDTPAVRNVVYVVSDGEETCGGDPVAEAEQLQQSEIGAIVNIIGFDIEESERKALEAIADAGAGDYFHADTAKQLRDTFKEERSALLNDWSDWQSENVNVFFDQQSDYVNQSSDLQSEALELSRLEEERQRDLTRYMEDIMEDVDTIEIRNLIRGRALGIRSYIRDEFYAIREEARKKGYELREQVRDEGYEEREEIRNQDK